MGKQTLAGRAGFPISRQRKPVARLPSHGTRPGLDFFHPIPERAMSLIPSAFVEKAWRQALSRLDTGSLEFIAPNGEVTIARGPKPGPQARFAIADWDVLRRIMARGDIGLGEEYIAGSWTTDNVERLVSLFLLNLDHFEDFSD